MDATDELMDHIIEITMEKPRMCGLMLGAVFSDY